MDKLVSTDWLAGELGAGDLHIVDASLFLPDHGRDAGAEFESGHIPGAVFLDLAELRDTNCELPMNLPAAEKFASRMQSLGIGDGSRIVIYDDSPLHSSARAWWMFKEVFGAHNVAVLDGGLAKWKAESRELESGRQQVRHRHFTPFEDRGAVRDLDQMKGLVGSGEIEIADARDAGRFTGATVDPRPNVASGHMPGAKNLPYGELFNADGTWKQGDDLHGAFQAAGIDLSKPLVTSCNSGVTAAVLLFGARLLGKEDAALYDGSWSEWGGCADTEKATGAA
ncbi:MAG: sulfurtransferase [Parasphingopyxis sp.]